VATEKKGSFTTNTFKSEPLAFRYRKFPIDAYFATINEIYLPSISIGTYLGRDLKKSYRGKELTTKMTAKEKEKDVKEKTDIRNANYGENADEAKVDAENKKKHVPYDPKGDTKNRQNTVRNR
jgi:hypothetical protein